MKFNNVIECSKNHIRNWLEFVNPMFRLSNKEIDLLSILITKFQEITNSTKCDDKKANALLFSTNYRKKIKSEMGIKDNYFDVLLNKLKKHNAIKEEGEYDNRRLYINKQIIPKTDKNGNLSLLVIFK